MQNKIKKLIASNATNFNNYNNLTIDQVSEFIPTLNQPLNTIKKTFKIDGYESTNFILGIDVCLKEKINTIITIIFKSINLKEVNSYQQYLFIKNSLNKQDSKEFKKYIKDLVKNNQKEIYKELLLLTLDYCFNWEHYMWTIHCGKDVLNYLETSYHINDQQIKPVFTLIHCMRTLTSKFNNNEECCLAFNQLTNPLTNTKYDFDALKIYQASKTYLNHKNNSFIYQMVDAYINLQK